MNKSNPPNPRRRFPVGKVFLWFFLILQIGWVFTCLFTLVAVLLLMFSAEPPFGWNIAVIVMAITLVALVVGPLLIRWFRSRIGKALAGETADKPQGRTDRILSAIMAVVLAGSGLYAGFNGRLYGSRHDRTGTEAPVLCWIIGSVLILLGIHFLYVSLFAIRNSGETEKDDKA